jgi:hypothetical protein
MCLSASFVHVHVCVFSNMFSLDQLLLLFLMEKVLYTNPPKEDYFA